MNIVAEKRLPSQDQKYSVDYGLEHRRRSWFHLGLGFVLEEIANSWK